MYDGREVYPNAPLEFVAAEIRFTYAPALSHVDAFDKLAKALKDIAPIARRDKIQTLTLTPTSAPTTEFEDQFRLLDRKSQTSITFTTNRVAVETTNYPEFPAFREIIARALAAVAEFDIAGVERVGLRYVDEIRVPVVISEIVDWKEWVDERLLAPTYLRKESATSSQGIVQFSTGSNRGLVFRFGAINGPSVVGNGPLKRRKKIMPGPYFLIDMDSYWEAPPETPAFSTSAVMGIVDELHQPTGETFAALITERLKDVVLRREEDET